MATDLKETLRDWLDGDTPVGRDKVEILRAAGLIAPVGYQITEIGRTLMIQNPPRYSGDVDEPECGPWSGKVSNAAKITVEQSNCLGSAIGGGVSAKDVQIGGAHYKKLGHHQPWEVLATWMTPEELRGYMKGTVIAYLAREQDKGGDTDVAKACHTMQLWEEVRKDK